MKISKHIVLIFVLGSIFLSSCSKDEPLLVVNVTKEFEVEFREQLSPADNLFEIIFTTINTQTCINAEISVSNNFSSDNIRITLNGVEEPTDCIPGIEPLIETVPFNINREELDIDINLRNQVFNKGNIYLGDGTYRLRMDTDHGLIYSDTRFKRIPDNKIWGYIGTRLQDNTENIQAAYNLFVNGSQLSDHLLEEGDYAHFKIDSNKELYGIEIPKELADYRLLAFSYEDSIEDIRSLIDEIKLQYSDLDILLINSYGDYIF